MDAKIDRIEKSLQGIEVQLQNLLELNKNLTHELIRMKKPPTPKEVPTSSSSQDTKPKSLKIIEMGTCIHIKGNTFDHRMLFKEFSGVWKKEHRAWEIPVEKYSNVHETLKERKIHFEVEKGTISEQSNDQKKHTFSDYTFIDESS